MSNQSKVTDFFSAQKKTDNTFRSAKKIGPNVSHCKTLDSNVGESSVKTPKRKKMVTKDKSIEFLEKEENTEK